MRLPRKQAAAGPALGRSPLPRRRPRLGCGEIPGEARAFPAFFRQRPECRNQTRRACRSCLLSESTRYQGLGIASPCLTRTWSRLWARGSACPGQAPSRSGSFLGFVHVVRLFFLWHRTGASRAARCLGTGSRGGAGRGRDGAPPSQEDPGPSPSRREGRLGPTEEAVSCSPAMEAAERTAHRLWQKMGSGHIWPTFVAFSPQKPKCSVFFLCFLVVTWNLSQVHCGTMGLPGVWGEGAPLDFGWAGAWFQGLHISPTAPGQGLRLCRIPRLIATRHGFLRAHGCRCSRRRAQARGRNGVGPCPPHLKASVLADVT